MSTLALSMIVRDAEAILGRCLGSVRGLVDEMVIADTGSADGTMAVARAAGARVVAIPWENDFARARNRCLEHVKSDWVLALDADEMLDPEAAKTIPALIGSEAAAGYLVTLRNYVTSLGERLWDKPATPNNSSLSEARAFPAYVEHENVRLFRRRPEIVFTGRVHETVGHALRASGGRLGRAGFVIHHFGLAADAATRARKNHLYRELGREKIREMPQSAQAHFELGLVEFDNFHNDTEAARLFDRACELDAQLAVAWLFAGLAQARLGNPAAALARIRRAESLGYRTALTAEAEGDAHYNLGEFEAARRAYRRVLERDPRNASAASKLGLAEVRDARVETGLDRLRRAIETHPEREELYDRAVTACVWLGRLEEAAACAERKLSLPGPAPECYLRAAALRVKCGDWLRALHLLQCGLDRYPRHERLSLALTEVSAQAARVTASFVPRTVLGRKASAAGADRVL
jgi:tetratricopeptide (TPR) repeat protein